MTRALIQQALDEMLHLARLANIDHAENKAITALRAHLAQPEQEPPCADAGLMPLIDDYAKAVHDGNDAACVALRQVIVASLEEREHLAQPEQKPYATVYEWDTPFGLHCSFSYGAHNGLMPDRAVAVYTATPVPAGMVPIPASDLVTMYAERPTSDAEMIEFARAVEAHHKIGVKHDNGN